MYENPLSSSQALTHWAESVTLSAGTYVFRYPLHSATSHNPTRSTSLGAGPRQGKRQGTSTSSMIPENLLRQAASVRSVLVLVSPSLSLVLFFLLLHQAFVPVPKTAVLPPRPPLLSVARFFLFLFPGFPLVSYQVILSSNCLPVLRWRRRQITLVLLLEKRNNKKRAISHGIVVVFSPAFVSFESHILQLLQLWVWHHLPGASLQRITFPPKLSYT